MPGNFIGFYLFGWLLKGKFSWRRFVLTSVFTLFFANLITAALVAIYYALFLPALFNPTWGAALTIGLCSYWFITMLPFALTIDPALIRIISKSKTELATPEILKSALKDESRDVAVALILTGALGWCDRLSLYIFTRYRRASWDSIVSSPVAIRWRRNGDGSSWIWLHAFSTGWANPKNS